MVGDQSRKWIEAIWNPGRSVSSGPRSPRARLETHHLPRLTADFTPHQVPLPLPSRIVRTA